MFEIIPTWNSLESNEKTEKGKEVQKRWKSLRDCFKGEITVQKKIPTGSGSQKRRKYIYFEQLQFLLTTFHERKTTLSLVPSNDTSEQEEPAKTPQSCDSEQNTLKPSTKARNRCSKRQSRLLKKICYRFLKGNLW